VKLTYLLAHKFSQDHIEVLFSIICRRGDWCNNPTALQFCSAYRAVLSHVGVVPSTGSNCLTEANDDILTDDSCADVFCRVCESAVELDHAYSALLPTLSNYMKNVTTHITGFVVRKLLPRLRCSECRALLVNAPSTSSFVLLKNNGGLVIPSAARHTASDCILKSAVCLCALILVSVNFTLTR